MKLLQANSFVITRCEHIQEAAIVPHAKAGIGAAKFESVRKRLLECSKITTVGAFRAFRMKMYPQRKITGITRSTTDASRIDGSMDMGILRPANVPVIPSLPLRSVVRAAFFSTGLTSLIFSLLATGTVKAQDGYARMASICASPLFDSTAEAKSGYEDAKVMLRNEMAYQAIGGWVSSRSDLEAIRAEVYGHLRSCNTTLEEIRRRDASVPNLSAIAKEGVGALPALDKSRRDTDGKLRVEDRKEVAEFAVTAVAELGQWAWDKYQASVERDKYKALSDKARNSAVRLWNVASNQCNTGRPMVYGIGIVCDVTKSEGLTIQGFLDGSPAKAAGLAAGDKIVGVNDILVTAQNCQEMLVAIRGPKETPVKISYSQNGTKKDTVILRSIAVYEAALLKVDINGSWNGLYDSDWVFFTNNSGRDLTDVSLYVRLDGRHGVGGASTWDGHLHYVGSWPAGATKIARYMSSASDGIVRNVSVDQIETLTYKLLSKEWSQDNTVQYTGAAFDEDVKRYWNEADFIGNWREETWANNAGFNVARKDEAGFPCSHVTVTASRGDNLQSLRWSMMGLKNRFPAGGLGGTVLNSARFFSDPNFNGWSPTRVTVKFEFPYTAFVAERVWDIK